LPLAFSRFGRSRFRRDGKLSQRTGEPMATKSILVAAPYPLNLEQCQKVLAQVLNKAGHPQCISGFKIGFQDLVDPPELHFTVDKVGGIAAAKG
jgi:hypothetical protein